MTYYDKQTPRLYCYGISPLTQIPGVIRNHQFSIKIQFLAKVKHRLLKRFESRKAY